MVLLNSSSLTLSSTSIILRRKKWPLLPYKGKWQQTFNQQLAMEALKKAATSQQQQQQHQHQQSSKEPHLLSALINSFSIYACDPTPSAYSFIIKILTQNSQFQQLLPILDRLEKFEKFNPPEHIFVNLIRIYGFANKIQDAIEIFFRIPKFRCTPSVSSLHAILSVLCKKKEGLQMVHQVLLKSHEAMNIRLEEASFRILITVLCKINKFSYAIEILNLMPHYGYDPDSKLYSLILSSLCKSRDLSSVEVLGFLEEIRKVGFSPNGFDYSKVIGFLVKVGRWLDALDILNQMKMSGIKPNVVCYTRVLDGIVSAGQFHKAEEVFDEMLVLGVIPDIYTYNIYVKGLCSQNNFETGFKMLVCMEELGCKPNVTTYNTLMGALCKAGELRKAREVLKKMGLKGVKVNLHTYMILIDRLIYEGEVVEAFGLLEVMLRKGLVPTSIIFDEMICGLCKRGLVSEAQQVLTEMIRRDVAPGASSWEALLVSRLELSFKEAISPDLDGLLSNLPHQVN